MKEVHAKREEEQKQQMERKAGKNKQVEQAAEVTCKQKAFETKRCQSGVKCVEPVHQKKKATGMVQKGSAKLHETNLGQGAA